MTHATIRPSAPALCTVEFAYDANAVASVKALPGASFDGRIWTVPTLSLPALRAIFAALIVDPAVVADYHRLLRLMLEDFAGAGLTVYLVGGQVRSRCLRKGEMGRHLGEVIETHRSGIAAVLRQGPIVAPKRVERAAVQPAVIELSAEIEPDSGLMGSYLKGVRNAQKKADKTKAIVKAKRRRKTPATA